MYNAKKWHNIDLLFFVYIVISIKTSQKVREMLKNPHF